MGIIYTYKKINKKNEQFKDLFRSVGYFLYEGCVKGVLVTMIILGFIFSNRLAK